MTSNPGVRMRRMSAADLERVTEIAESLKDAPNWPRAAYLTALDPDAAPRRIAWVAEEPETGALLGFAIVALLPPAAELEMIAVAAERKRRGTGRLLLTTMVEELKSVGVCEVILVVRASNHAALGLYRDLGSSETGRRRRYYADPEEDAVLMNLRLM